MTTEQKRQYKPLSEKAHRLLSKWTHFDQYRYPAETPLERRLELVIKRDQIPAFLEDLRTLRIGIEAFNHWVCMNIEDPDEKNHRYAESQLWDCPNIHPGAPGWLDYSIDYVIAYLQLEYPHHVDWIGMKGTPSYQEIPDIQALSFEIDFYDEIPDTPGPVEILDSDNEWANIYRKYPHLFNKK